MSPESRIASFDVSFKTRAQTQDHDHDHESGFGVSTILRPLEKNKVKKPRMYQVLLHNDDFTPREFVVHVLQTIFKKNENLSVDIMMRAHKSGVARVAVYSFGIAETKAHQANQLAKKQQFPLRFSIEPIEDEDSDSD